jgi:hypothetical protein
MGAPPAAEGAGSRWRWTQLKSMQKALTCLDTRIFTSVQASNRAAWIDPMTPLRHAPATTGQRKFLRDVISAGPPFPVISISRCHGLGKYRCFALTRRVISSSGCLGHFMSPPPEPRAEGRAHLSPSSARNYATGSTPTTPSVLSPGLGLSHAPGVPCPMPIPNPGG